MTTSPFSSFRSAPRPSALLRRGHATRLSSFVGRPSLLAGRAGLAGLSGLLAVVLTSGTAAASPDFPVELREVAQMDCTPSCSICHTSNPGRRGTASQPFALSMTDAELLGEANVLVAGDVDSVAIAYAALPDDHDSDGDGDPDKVELEAEGASDPSADGVGLPCAAEVKYGCGGQISGGHTGPWKQNSALLLFLSFLGAALLRRKLVPAALKR